MKHLWLLDIGQKVLSIKRMAIASTAALGLYFFGSEGMTYVSTAGRLVSSEVGDYVPISFEIERARTMIGQLTPSIKRNMVVIAQEEVEVESLRRDVSAATSALEKQQQALLELRQNTESENPSLKIGSRMATKAEVDRELQRRFARFRMLEATLAGKEELLVSREESLESARRKLDSMIQAKRDLEIQAEDLETRLRTAQSDSMNHKINFDDSDVGKCQELVNDLKIRLDVADKMIVTNGVYDDSSVVSLPISDGSIRKEIDAYFSQK